MLSTVCMRPEPPWSLTRIFPRTLLVAHLFYSQQCSQSTSPPRQILPTQSPCSAYRVQRETSSHLASDLSPSAQPPFARPHQPPTHCCPRAPPAGPALSCVWASGQPSPTSPLPASGPFTAGVPAAFPPEASLQQGRDLCCLTHCRPPSPRDGVWSMVETQSHLLTNSQHSRDQRKMGLQHGISPSVTWSLKDSKTQEQTYGPEKSKLMNWILSKFRTPALQKETTMRTKAQPQTARSVCRTCI